MKSPISINEARARKMWRFFLTERLERECPQKYEVKISVRKSKTHSGLEGRLIIKKKEPNDLGRESLSFILDRGVLNRLYPQIEAHPEVLLASVSESWAWQGDSADSELVRIGRFLISEAKEFIHSKSTLAQATAFADRELLQKVTGVRTKTSSRRDAL